MFKRLFWLMVGTALGASGWWWARRALRQAVRRWAPDSVWRDLEKRVAGLRADVAGAAAEGRRAMREREAELRSALARPGVGRVGPA